MLRLVVDSFSFAVIVIFILLESLIVKFFFVGGFSSRSM